MSVTAKVHFKIPGKTFLSGEYLALFGGPSLVLTTNPLFEVICHPLKTDEQNIAQNIAQSSSRKTNPFHMESPAGKYISQHAVFFANWDIEFRDPYVTGGFGASTAQFIAVCLLHLKSGDLEQEKFFSTKRQIALEVWQKYRELFPQNNLRPSGADLVAQILGEITVFEGRTFQAETLRWPFLDKDVLIFKTGNKVATHIHLQESKLDSEVLQKALRPAAQAAIESLKSSSWDEWLQAQKTFSEILDMHHLTHPDTQLLLHEILKMDGVLQARGCGALGADVIAICIEQKKKEAIIRELKHLKYMASLLSDQAYGTFIDVIPQETI